MRPALIVTWSGTLEAAAARRAQKPAPAPVLPQARNITERVAVILRDGHDRSLHDLVETTGLTVSQLNSAVYNLMHRGLVERVGAKKGGRGHVWTAAPARYRWRRAEVN